RNDSIGSTGTCGLGRRPSCQPQLFIRFNTAGSFATIVIGTSWVAFCPATIEAAWWSPRNTITRLSLPYFCTQEVRLPTEYATDLANSSRTRPESFQTSSGDLP